MELLLAIIVHVWYSIQSKNLKMTNLTKGVDLQLGLSKELIINKTQQKIRSN